MTDREKVVKGFECCRDGFCNLCPYDNITDESCRQKLEDDALELLKPRVLSFLEAYCAEVCWLEQKGYDPYPTLDACYWNKETYNIGWRCWSQKPTEAQVKDTKWK